MWGWKVVILFSWEVFSTFRSELHKNGLGQVESKVLSEHVKSFLTDKQQRQTWTCFYFLVSSSCPAGDIRLWMQVAPSCWAQRAVMTYVTAECKCQGNSHKCQQQQCIHVKNGMKSRFMTQTDVLCTYTVTPDGSDKSRLMAPSPICKMSFNFSLTRSVLDSICKHLYMKRSLNRSGPFLNSGMF